MVKNRRTRLAVIVVLVTTLCSLVRGGAHAQSLDPASQEALASVLRMLQDPALRHGLTAGNAQAEASDRQVQSLTGGSAALTQEVYELAGQIFEDLAHASGGDVQAMNRILARGQSDPDGLAGMLSPRTLERLRALATRLSDQR